MSTNERTNDRAVTRRSRGKARLSASLLMTVALVLAGCGSTTTTQSTATTTVSSGIALSSTGATDATTTAGTIADTSAAITAFLATLSDEQVATLTYDYDDATKSTSWSNFPVTFVERAGLNLADLTTEQQAAALAVMEGLLNEESYATVVNIMGGDQYLKDNSSSSEASLGQYYIAIFGDASATGEFAVQFGGHHLGINADLNGTTNAITFAPTHLGVQPAVYTNADGVEVQPFDEIYTTAFAFYNSLTDTQKAALYQGEDVAAMVCAPGSSCTYPTGTGLVGADLTDAQKELLLDVVANWAGMADDQTNAAARAKMLATLDTTYVNWSGATVYDMTTGDGIYFQISGPNVYVEFAAQNGSAGADIAGVTTSGWGHVHTIYRDPTNDYALSVEQGASSGPGGGGAAPSGAGPAS